jgi:hypothetical protein
VDNKCLSEIGKDVGELCEEKNEAYGDSFAKVGAIMEEMYPNGIAPGQYTDMLGLVRVLDKLFRIATRKDAFGESPWRDVAGYGILGVFNDAKSEFPPLPSDYAANEALRLLARETGLRDTAIAFLPGGEPVYDSYDDVEPACPLQNEIDHQMDKMDFDSACDCGSTCERCIFEAPVCDDCYHMKLPPDEMPCKKCIDKPFKPHFTLTLPVYNKPPSLIEK